MPHGSEGKASTDKCGASSPLREQHLESDKERVQFVFAIGTKKRLDRIARYYDLSATALIEQWARREARNLAEKAERKARRAIIYERNVRTGK